MENNEQDPANDPAIIYRIIFDRWTAGETIKEISEQTGLDLKKVMAILKEQQKSLV